MTAIVIAFAVIAAAFVMVGIDFYYFVYHGKKLNLVPAAGLATNVALLVIVLLSYFAK